MSIRSVLEWTWRKSLLLIWVMVTVLLAWTWSYAWTPLTSIANNFQTSFLSWFPPFWLTATWRVVISVMWATTTAWLLWAHLSSSFSFLWHRLVMPIFHILRPYIIKLGENQPPIFKSLQIHRLPTWLNRLRIWIWSWWHPPNIEWPHEDPDLAAADEWASRYIPARESDVYGAVLGFAERTYDETNSLTDILDKKADDLMKIAGVVGAALAAGGRIEGASEFLKSSRYLHLAIGSLIFTMLVCARARKPAKRTVPMTIRTALVVTDTSVIPPGETDNEPANIDSPTPALELGVGGDEAMREEAANENEGAGTDGNEMDQDLDRGQAKKRPTKTQMEAGIAASYHYATVGIQMMNDWKARQLSRATFLFCSGLILLMLAFLRPFG
jgi:hypothetical protein